MRRREFMIGAAALGLGDAAMAQDLDYAALQAGLWERFPYERIESSGADALAEWTRLKSAGRLSSSARMMNFCASPKASSDS